MISPALALRAVGQILNPNIVPKAQAPKAPKASPRYPWHPLGFPLRSSDITPKNVLFSKKRKMIEDLKNNNLMN